MLGFSRVPVARNFMEIRGGGGEYQDFPSNFLFCLTVTKIFVGEPFYALFHIISGSECVCR